MAESNGQCGAADFKKSSGKTVVWLIGASRGFGKSIAIQGISNKIKHYEDLHLILFGRSVEGMEQLKKELMDGRATSKEKLQVSIGRLDVSEAKDPKKFEETFLALLEKTSLEGVERIIFIQNQGVLIPKWSHGCTAEEINDLTISNVSSFMMIHSFFTNWFINKIKNITQPPAIRFINTSSVAAIQPLTGTGLYCPHKAARMMYFQTVAAESSRVPELRRVNLKALNYAPGPMKTELMDDIHKSVDPALKSFTSFFSIDDSSQAMWDTILKDTYTSGTQVDLSDVRPDLQPKN